MVVIYGYLERDNDKVFKFHTNNPSFFEISASLFQVPAANKRHPLNLRH